MAFFTYIAVADPPPSQCGTRPQVPIHVQTEHAHQVDLACELQHVLQVVGSDVGSAEHLMLTVCGCRYVGGGANMVT